MSNPGQGFGQESSAIQALLQKSGQSVQASRGTANLLQNEVDTLMSTFQGATAQATQQVHAAIANELAAILREMEALDNALGTSVLSQVSNDEDGQQLLARVGHGTQTQVGSDVDHVATTTLNGMNN